MHKKYLSFLNGKQVPFEWMLEYMNFGRWEEKRFDDWFFWFFEWFLFKPIAIIGFVCIWIIIFTVLFGK
jgi:hypothetical protein